MFRHQAWTASFVGALAALAIVAGTAQAAAPANDNFANAAALTGTLAPATGNTSEATAEPFERGVFPGETPERTVWWTWTAPASGPLVVDTCGSSAAAQPLVYTGTSLFDLIEINPHPVSCGLMGEKGTAVTFEAVSG